MSLVGFRFALNNFISLHILRDAVCSDKSILLYINATAKTILRIHSQCCDGFYYTGITNNLNQRLLQHQAGINPFCYTQKRRPVELKWYEEYFDVLQAICREKQLKGWSRAKKESLFTEDFDALKELAKCSERKALEEEEAYKLIYVTNWDVTSFD